MCAGMRRLIPVQRDEWTEEVNEALWIDEKVSVRVHKVGSCSVLSKSGSPTVTSGNHKQFHDCQEVGFTRWQCLHPCRAHDLRACSWPVQLQMVIDLCRFLVRLYPRRCGIRDSTAGRCSWSCWRPPMSQTNCEAPRSQPIPPRLVYDAAGRHCDRTVSLQGAF